MGWKRTSVWSGFHSLPLGIFSHSSWVPVYIMVLSDSQRANAAPRIYVMLLGTVTLSSLGHPLKRASSMAVRPSGSVTSLRDGHSSKAASPMLVTL